jgi:hypothetical protein
MQAAMQILNRWASEGTTVWALCATAKGQTSTLVVGHVELRGTFQVVVAGNGSALKFLTSKAQMSAGPLQVFPVPVAPGEFVNAVQVWLDPGTWIAISDSERLMGSAVPQLQ